MLGGIWQNNRKKNCKTYNACISLRKYLDCESESKWGIGMKSKRTTTLLSMEWIS